VNDVSDLKKGDRVRLNAVFGIVTAGRAERGDNLVSVRFDDQGPGEADSVVHANRLVLATDERE
jgi:hypothetical protein